MTTETAISEAGIAEDTSSAAVPVVTTLFLQRRPVMIYETAAYRTEMGDDFGGQPIVTVLERTGWAVEPDYKGGFRNNPSSTKILRELWPVFRAELGTTIQIYAGSQPISTEDNIYWQGPFDFVVGEDSSVQPMIEYAFLGLRFTSNDQPHWDLLMVDLDVDTVGEVFTL